MRHRGEEGFTLPEVMMAVTVLSIIIAPLTLGFITALRVVGRADEKLQDSRSASISSAYFAADVAAANTIVQPDSTADACGGSALISFRSTKSDQGSTGSTYTVSYVDTTVDSVRQLVRYYCPTTGSSTGRTRNVMATSISPTVAPAITCYATTYSAGSPPVSCNGASARTVTMVVTQKANSPTPADPSPAPYTFTLVGTRRTT